MLGRRSLLLTLAVVGSLGAGQVEAAQISLSSYMPEFVGIDAATATLSGSVAYIQRIDLRAPGIGFTTTPASGPLDTTAQTTSQFLQSSGSQVAINANFFAPCCASVAEPKSLTGVAISNGTVVSPLDTGSDPTAGSVFVSQTNMASIHASNGAGPVDLTNAYNAVSGFSIVNDGVDVSSKTSAGDPFGIDPRTGVGLSRDNSYLFLIAIDGRQPGYSLGVTASEEAQLMLLLGVYDGLNLDGGGSTALAISDGFGGAVDVNRPSMGTERYDGNNFGVFAAPLSAVPLPASAPMFGAALALLGAVGYRARRKRVPATTASA